MDILTLGIIFGVIWFATTVTFIVLYKKKPSGTTDERAIKQLIENQKEQNNEHWW